MVRRGGVRYARN